MQLPPEVRAFLTERRFAVLATIAKDCMPHQTVMWFALRGDHVLLNTARGRIKDQHLRRNPRASISIEDAYRYVTLAGSVILDDNPVSTQADIAYLARRYEGESERAERMIENFRTQERVSIRLKIENVVVNGFDQ